MVEEPFGWAKTIGGLARPMLRGAQRLGIQVHADVEEISFVLDAYFSGLLSQVGRGRARSGRSPSAGGEASGCLKTSTLRWQKWCSTLTYISIFFCTGG